MSEIPENWLKTNSEDFLYAASADIVCISSFQG